MGDAQTGKPVGANQYTEANHSVHITNAFGVSRVDSIKATSGIMYYTDVSFIDNGVERRIAGAWELAQAMQDIIKLEIDSCSAVSIDPAMQIGANGNVYEIRLKICASTYGNNVFETVYYSWYWVEADHWYNFELPMNDWLTCYCKAGLAIDNVCPN